MELHAQRRLFIILVSVFFLGILLLWIPQLLHSVRTVLGAATTGGHLSSDLVSKEWSHANDAILKVLDIPSQPVSFQQVKTQTADVLSRIEQVAASSSVQSEKKDAPMQVAPQKKITHPDLIVEVGVAHYCPAGPAQSVCLERITLRNAGGVRAGPSTVYVNTKYYPVPAIEAGATYILFDSLQFPPSPAAVKVKITADAKKEVVESIEDNNSFAFPLT